MRRSDVVIQPTLQNSAHSLVRAYPNRLSPALAVALTQLAARAPPLRRAVGAGGFDEWLVRDPALAGPLREMQLALAVDYVRDCGLTRAQWPVSPTTEPFRLKRYREGDEFPPHVDVVDAATARRFLAFLWCVVAPESGGETAFLPDGPVFAPEVGRCIVFPPMWPFLHAGRPARGEKVILSSYLHYS